MKKITKIAIVFILIFTLLDGRAILAEEKTVSVATDVLNMRSGPGLTYDVIGSFKKGDQMKVIATSDEWLQVQASGKTGWVAEWLTTTGGQSNHSASAIVSQVNSLNVRAEATVGSAILTRMNAGDEARVLEQKAEWIRISFQGTEGWVHSDYVAEISISQTETSEQSPKTNQQTTDTSETFTVAVDTLNVRKQADLSSKRIGLVHKNESYKVLQMNENWVQISLTSGQDGWVYSFHGTLSSSASNSSDTQTASINQVTIIEDGTNIRQEATTSSQIVRRANAGERFDVLEEVNNWYKLALPDNATAYVAKWVVSNNQELIEEPTKDIVLPENPSQRKKARVAGTLQGITIVIDPGHGGTDRGTTGKRGTDEKDLTLKTSELLASKLKAAGATVHLTRESDEYVTLRKRVGTSHQHTADAFISIHYDAALDASITGFTTYFTQSKNEKLAGAINNGLGTSLSLRNRGKQQADYFVLRENRQNSVLIELGFLSNPLEEMQITTDHFREQATRGIYNGLLQYFNPSS